MKNAVTIGILPFQLILEAYERVQVLLLAYSDTRGAILMKISMVKAKGMRFEANPSHIKLN